MVTDSASRRREFSDDDQALLRELETLVRGNPAATAQAAARLADFISDSAVWREAEREYKSRQDWVRAMGFTAEQQKEELRRWKPNASVLLAPVIKRLRPYFRLNSRALQLLVNIGPQTHRPTVEEAWDVVVLLWVLTTPDVPLAELGLSAVADWGGDPPLWGRRDVLRNELVAPEPRAVCFARARSAIEEIKLSRNPLLTAALDEPNRPPDIQRLFKALVMVEVMSAQLAGECQEVIEQWQRYGGPKPYDFPEYLAARQAEAKVVIEGNKEAARQRGEDPHEAFTFVGSSMWADLLMSFERSYREWCSRLDKAIKAAPDAKRMDVGEDRPAEKWTAKLLAELRELAGILHPSTYGEDGLGYIRIEPRPLPARFFEVVEAVSRRRLVLADVPATPDSSGTTEPFAGARSVAVADESNGQTASASCPCTHGDDFTWVIWYGTEYKFTKGNQAQTVKHLWEQWKKSGFRDGCGLSDDAIAEKVGAAEANFRVKTVFRGHKALGAMVCEAGKGIHALYKDPPSAPQRGKRRAAMLQRKKKKT